MKEETAAVAADFTWLLLLVLFFAAHSLRRPLGGQC